MLTYQLHTRIFQIEDGDKLEFPNKAQLEFKLAPGTTFGTDDGPSRTLVRAREATILINANTGRWTGQSRPPLEQLNVILESPTSQLCLNGDNLTYDFECSNIEELQGTFLAFKWILPPLLNLEFSDPPVVKLVRPLFSGSTSLTNGRSTPAPLLLIDSSNILHLPLKHCRFSMALPTDVSQLPYHIFTLPLG